MSILDYSERSEQKDMIVSQLVYLGCEDQLEELTDQDLENFVDLAIAMANAVDEEETEVAKRNVLANYILVLWAEMVADLGKESSLL